MILHLIRHAEIAPSADPHAHRQPPVAGELSPVGQRQTAELAQRFGERRPDRVFSSPLGRALQTAQALAEPEKIHLVPWMEEWRPARPGEDPARFEEMMRAVDGLPLERRWKTEAGESTYAMADRIVPPLLALLAAEGLVTRGACAFEAESVPGDREIALVAHGGSLNVALRHLLGLPPSPLPLYRLPHAGVVRIGFLGMGPAAHPWIEGFWSPSS